VSESSTVSLRNQKSAVFTVNYRRRKPGFRRVSVASGVRSLSLYLVVKSVFSCELLCLSVIVICVVITSIANKYGIQSEPSLSY
jgi:hypothetical protein